MSNYIESNANRFYVATEAIYGVAAAVAPANRFPATAFECHQTVEVGRRRDKTGSRTYLGSSSTATRDTSFVLSTHLTSWDVSNLPSYGPLVQAAMGASPEVIENLMVTSVDGTQIQTQSPHGLSAGSAVSNDSEIRFVATLVDSSTFLVNAPFSAGPGVGASLGKTVGYRLATQLPSITLYDYWDPVTGVSRLVTGAGVNKFQIDVKGDVHELAFAGPAADVVDSCSGAFGRSGLTAFPEEPETFAFDYSIVDGQLGQVWMGSPLNRMFALTEASVEINNNLRVRSREFGSAYPTAIVPGNREVLCSFTLFSQADTVMQGIYAAAKSRMPISALLQLGQQKGQMMAVYLPNVLAEQPLFNDSEPFLLWEFKNNFGQGISNDEAYIAFA